VTEEQILKYGYELLELSKRFLQEDGKLNPTAFLVRGTQPELFRLDFSSETSKRRSCAAAVARAKALKALGIVAVFTATGRDLTRVSRKQRRGRYILVLFSSNRLKTWILEQPFQEKSGGFSFGPPVQDREGIQISLLHW